MFGFVTGWSCNRAHARARAYAGGPSPSHLAKGPSEPRQGMKKPRDDQSIVSGPKPLRIASQRDFEASIERD